MRPICALIAVLAALSQALAAESSPNASANQGNRRVSLVYINDVHAQLEPHSELFWFDGKEEFVRDAGGLSRIATVFNRLRTERPDELLFIDGGDTIQGSGPAAWTEGQVVVDPMNTLGLDIAIPGNWSVAYGERAWRARAAEFNYPIVAANMRDAETGELLFAPYLVKEVNGVRIGVIGFTEPDIPTRQPPHLSEGLAFDANQVLPPLVTELREEHQVDLVILATHIGLPKAIGLADTIEGVDVVLSADTHERTYEPIIRGNTWVVEAGAFGSFVGILDIHLNEVNEIVGRDWRLIELRPELFPEDPQVKATVDAALAPHRDRMNRVIGHTDIWLARYEVLNTSLDGLIANAFREATGADVALSNGYRFAPPTAPGPITYADLWNWLPISLELKRGEATGRQLHDYWERELQNVLADDPAQLFGGWLPRVAGMTVDFLRHMPAGERVRDVYIDGVPVDDDKRYVIAAGHRPGAPADSVHRVRSGHSTELLGITTHDAVERYLQRHSPIRSSGGLDIRCIDIPGLFMRSQILDQLERNTK